MSFLKSNKQVANLQLVPGIGTPTDIDRLQYHCTVQSCNLFKTSAQSCSLQLNHGYTKLFYTRTISYEHELQKLMFIFISRTVRKSFLDHKNNSITMRLFQILHICNQYVLSSNLLVPVFYFMEALINNVSWVQAITMGLHGVKNCHP